MYLLKTRPELAGGFNDSRSPRGGSHRATGQKRARQQRVANFEMHLLQWNVERVRGDLREDCPSPGSNIRGVDEHAVMSFAINTRDRGRCPATRGIG